MTGPTMSDPTVSEPSSDAALLRSSRRRLAYDGLGVVLAALGFGLVYGLSARDAGFSLVEASAMSILAFGGAAQFAAVQLVAGGLPWAGIVLLTGFLNARHLLYSAALAPWLSDRPKAVRAGLAHLLTDEAFALSLAHFRRIGRGDVPGYLIAGILLTFIPWNVATVVGVLLAGGIPNPEAYGLDIVFPATMAGLAVGLVTGSRELVAAVVGAIVAVGVGLAWDPSGGIIVGGLIGPFAGLVVPSRTPPETWPESPVALGRVARSQATRRSERSEP